MLAQNKITVSIGALSRATRIPVNTIRTWEKRYGFPQASRTESGHRLYSPDVITHLRLVARALELGHRARQLLSLDETELRALIGEQDRPREVEKVSSHVAEWMESVRRFDDGALVGSFRRVVAQAGLVQFVIQEVPELLKAVGQAWEEGRLEVEHEHFASECLRDFLANEWRPMAVGVSGRKVVLATLPGESHSLGLHMIACLYAFCGYQMYFLGSNLPVSNLVAVTTDLKVDVLSLSISAYSDALTTRQHLEELISVLPQGVSLHLGGSGAPDDLAGSEHFSELSELYQFLDA
jgi:DNA-binding transcriptional MerR regulator/methylmalonyl-CoA mutase cobalamin-binding subunit